MSSELFIWTFEAEEVLIPNIDHIDFVSSVLSTLGLSVGFVLGDFVLCPPSSVLPSDPPALANG